MTFVEFLDFECESCRAAYPANEQLRKDYEGRVTFVVRYFPIPSHFNAERAVPVLHGRLGGDHPDLRVRHPPQPPPAVHLPRRVLTLWAVLVLTLITEQFWSYWRTLG